MSQRFVWDKNLFERNDENRSACLRINGRRARLRKQRGNMIALISVVTIGLVLAILFFALKYTSMLGTNQEQRTAIEGAALQAANDISRIVYEDPNFGFVAISDFAPIGYDTTARDGQLTPVRGINTILGTVRLDMIIADALGNTQMQSLAQADYNNAMTAVQTLQAELTDACLPTPKKKHRDWDGNVVNVYKDAVAAYNQNIIRMSDSKSALDVNSVHITLGVLKNGAATNTQIPQPSKYSNVTSDQTRVETFQNNQQLTCYKSYINVPYGSAIKSYPFVFCGVDNSLKLVDINQFSTDVSNLPYALETIVKVEGQQVYGSDPTQAQSGTHLYSAACAQPASAGDPRPYPGAMAIGFPNGLIPEITSISDILNKPAISRIPMTAKTSDSTDPGSDPVLPPTTYPTLGSTGGMIGYHWIKRAGTRPNVQSIASAFSKTFSSIVTGGAAAGTLCAYTFDASGNVQTASLSDSPNRQVPQSNHQVVGKSMVNFKSTNSKTYGAVFSDLVAIPGTIYGGIHAGEPLLGKGQANSWDAAGTTYGVPILSLGGLVSALLAVLTYVIGTLTWPITTVLTFLLGIPPAASGFTPDTVRGPHVVVPPASATTRTPRDTYTQQGLAVDMEFPQVTNALLW